MNEMQDTRPVWRPRRPSGMADTQPMWRQPPDDDELREGLGLGEPTCRGYGPVDPRPAHPPPTTQTRN
jgi:hypothetical protein